MEIKPTAAGAEGPGAGTAVWLGPCGGTYGMAASRDEAEMQKSSVAADVKPPTLISINKEGRKCLWLLETELSFRCVSGTNLSKRNVQKAQATEGTSLWFGFVCLLGQI